MPVGYRAMIYFPFFLLDREMVVLNIYSRTAYIIISEVTVYDPSQYPLFCCATFYWLANLFDHNLSFLTNLKSIFVMVLTRSDVHLSPVSSSCWHCIICWFCPQPPTSSPTFLQKSAAPTFYFEINHLFKSTILLSTFASLLVTHPKIIEGCTSYDLNWKSGQNFLNNSFGWRYLIFSKTICNSPKPT